MTYLKKQLLIWMVPQLAAFILYLRYVPEDWADEHRGLAGLFVSSIIALVTVMIGLPASVADQRVKEIREQSWKGKRAPTLAPSDATLRAWLVSGAIVPPAGERPARDGAIFSFGYILSLALALVAMVVTFPLWSHT